MFSEEWNLILVQRVVKGNPKPNFFRPYFFMQVLLGGKWTKTFSCFSPIRPALEKKGLKNWFWVTLPALLTWTKFTQQVILLINRKLRKMKNTQTKVHFLKIISVISVTEKYKQQKIAFSYEIMIDWLINFDSMSTSPGLFYA